MSDSARVAADLTAMLPTAIAAAIFAMTLAVSFDVGKHRGRREQRKRASSNTRTLRRYSDYERVICERADDYGLAVADMDDGLEIFAFNDNDEVYQEVWIHPDEYAELADVLSANACRAEGGQILDSATDGGEVSR